MLLSKKKCWCELVGVDKVSKKKEDGSTGIVARTYYTLVSRWLCGIEV